MKKDLGASDHLRRIYPEDGMNKEFSREVTFQVTENCNLACTYCYQGCKSGIRMTWDIAKKIVDWMYSMWDKNDPDSFINQNTKMIILDFIGGEPMLEVELIDKIVSYFWTIAIERRHPWAETFMISIATNGTQHFKPEVQKFIYKYKGHLSYGVSIDGPKEMHDACRIHHDGRGSFDEAYAAQKDFNEHFYESSGTKATIARANLPYLSTLIKYYVEQGYDQVHANYVYEEDWNFDDARLLYNQMKEIADYILDLDHEVEIALFDDRYFVPMDENDNNNWCFIAGTQILTSTGYQPIETIKIGDLVYTSTGELKPVINIMQHLANNVGKLTCSGCLPTSVTEDHKFYINKYLKRNSNGTYDYQQTDKIAIKDVTSKDRLQLFRLPIGTNDIDKSIAYLVGRFIGDGNIAKTSGNVPCICCGYTEKDELEQCFKNANIEYRITKSHTTYDFYATKKINTNSQNYEKFVKLCTMCGDGAKNKCIPTECFTWNKNSLESLIQGYISADGCCRKTGQIVCKTISQKLANELMLVLRTIGYFPTCHKHIATPIQKLLNRIVNVNDHYEIYFYTNSNKSRFQKNINNVTTTSGAKFIQSEPALVYNITVAENHSYIANGYIVSNCGGTGAMLAFDPKGDAFPCIRYMNSSLNGSQVPLKIGSVDEGIYETDDAKQKLEMLQSITRRSQSTDECFYCPIACGCSWCSGWNYQEFGTPNKRSTRICPMHKARSLANVYYWNKKYAKDGVNKYFFRHLPDDEALKIIDQKELELLNKLEKDQRSKTN